MSFPAYLDYKDSGVPWLGDIPARWSVGRIKDLFEIRKRIAGELGHDVLSITQSGLRVKDVEGNEGQQAMDYSKYQKVLPGEFAMNHMDLLTGWIDIATQGGVTSPDYRVFGARNAEAVDAIYFLRVFQMAYSARQFYPFGQGSSQLGRWRLPKDEFYAFPVPIPPLDEQKQIRLFLDRETAKIDALVAEQERLIALLKEKRQAVISHAVTKGLDPDAPMKDSGVEWLGEVPAHWQVDRISRLFKKVGSGTTPSSEAAFKGGTVNWVTTGELRELPITVTRKRVNEAALDSLSSLQVYPPGTLLIAMYGATIGRLGWLEKPACTNQACCAMANPVRIETRFAFYCLWSATEALMLLGSGGGQPNINQEKVRAFRLPAPPLSEQQSIVAFLDRETNKIGELVERALGAISLLQERRAALISAAVTGKIDVRGLVEQQEMEAA
ncbi:type I restriction enzyme, S subunit [Altererythrobacter xiamenensis]|uniref:Type I restriction enzyme, S subunit n=1 Tax=Altererythrobacter xiamenensis TaxID=1316679 RepID=A0A1Y6F8J9_9SPHN|nr:restriction endonuclease subunit S [Altererythrobacter xiamenensis]SMQ69710.1 type I restriction enzyme, S subunit [Altererythrobacter xiamenensis]